MCGRCEDPNPKEMRGDICYKCHVGSIKWGGLVTLRSDAENHHTQRELAHETIKAAAKEGREIQRVGERWI